MVDKFPQNGGYYYCILLVYEIVQGNAENNVYVKYFKSIVKKLGSVDSSMSVERRHIYCILVYTGFWESKEPPFYPLRVSKN